MGSSNRRWPNMFKAKACSPYQWQSDISSSLISSGSHRSPYNSVGRREEIRTAEPKLRWNPKPEQIRILEDIFNSGMVNPPRDEITNIRAQLQQYGEVGDANIFYWFQNRKSRSKQKLRSLQNSKNNQTPQTQNTCSSSEKSVSPNDHQILIPTETALLSSTADVGLNEITPPAAEPVWFPMHDHNGGGVDDDITQRFFFSELSNGIQDGQAKLPTEQQPHHLLSEIMYHGSASKKEQEVGKAMKMQPSHLSFSMGSIPTTHTDTLIQGTGEQIAVSPVIPAKSTVVIHGVAYEMPVGPLNLREAFGDGAVLMDASCQPMPTNGWGVTLHSLQPGAFYYLI